LPRRDQPLALGLPPRLQIVGRGAFALVSHGALAGASPRAQPSDSASRSQASMLARWRLFISCRKVPTVGGRLSASRPSSRLTTQPWPRLSSVRRAASVGSCITLSAKSPFFSEISPPSVLIERTSPAQDHASSSLTA